MHNSFFVKGCQMCGNFQKCRTKMHKMCKCSFLHAFEQNKHEPCRKNCRINLSSIPREMIDNLPPVWFELKSQLGLRAFQTICKSSFNSWPSFYCLWSSTYPYLPSMNPSTHSFRNMTASFDMLTLTIFWAPITNASDCISSIL